MARRGSKNWKKYLLLITTKGEILSDGDNFIKSSPGTFTTMAHRPQECGCDKKDSYIIHTQGVKPSNTCNTVLSRYLTISQPQDTCLVTYVYLDHIHELRSKLRSIPFTPETVSDVPLWSYDGSCTDQAEATNADLYLYPATIYDDPFFGGHHKLVLCESFKYTRKPVDSNKRHSCLEVMEKAADSVPWFGMTQKYILLDLDTRPYGWPKSGPMGGPDPTYSYYGAIGPNQAMGREVSLAHIKACIHAGVKISGAGGQSTPAQWEFQLGPCVGIQMGDDHWMARYILQRVAEDFGLSVSFDPKPFSGDWKANSCYVTFSTQPMREEGGLIEIEKGIDKLSNRHADHLLSYDSITKYWCDEKPQEKFSAGVANRTTGIRIPRLVADSGFGYFEDRRPAANCDPYCVTEALVKTICLNK